MSVTPDQPAPYAPASAIIQLIERHRSKGLPTVVDADALQRIGTQVSIIPRTLQALKTLELIGENGAITQRFDDLRLASAGDYQQCLAEWLKHAYADALMYIDPTTDDEVAIRDAFRKYIPTGQQDRMVTLFIGLFTYAGVMNPKAKVQSAKRGQTTAVARVVKATAPMPRGQRNSPPPRLPDQPVTGLPPAIAGLLTTLPSEGDSWPAARRDSFLETFKVLLNYTFKVCDQEPGTETASELNPDAA